MPATILKPDSSLSTVLDELCFTHARVEANPLTAPFAADFDPAFADWKTCNEQETKLRTTLVRHNALIAAGDDELDGIADAVHHAVLLEVKSDRKSALYLRYFEVTLSQLKKSGSLEKMRGWVPSLTTSPSPALASLGVRLAKAVEAADAAIAARLASEQANRDFRTIGARKELIDTINGVRKALYGKLSELPHTRPELHLPASFAEPFFRHETTKKKAEPAIGIEDIKAQVAASKELTASLEAKLVEMEAVALEAAKIQKEVDEAKAELARATELRDAAAAKVAGLIDKKT